MARDDKTEKPTAKRRGEARKKGQVAKSSDLNGSIVLGAGLIGLIALGPTVMNGAGALMVTTFRQIAHPGQAVTGAGLNGLLHQILQTLLNTVAPIAGMCMLAGVLVNIAQVGVRPSLQTLKPSFGKINPVSGAKNLFGARILFETGKSLVKVAIVGAVTAIALVPELTNPSASVGTTPQALAYLMGTGAVSVAERAVIAYVLIGIIDIIYQRRRTQKNMRMTKQEVKDEVKQYAAPPEVRAAVKRRQMQLARARMMAAVPQADVVVTNPTHYAVALSYDGTRPAPVLIAKGKGYVALQIRRIAEEHEIAIVADPPLARALHHSVEIDQMIPEELYAAVAQVLAFVYRMAARRKVAV